MLYLIKYRLIIIYRTDCGIPSTSSITLYTKMKTYQILPIYYSQIILFLIMVSRRILVFSFLLFQISSQTCPSYTCLGSNLIDCLYPTSPTVVTVSPCALGYYCPVEGLTPAKCASPSPNTRFPGEYCYEDWDCISNTCHSNSCIGLPLLQKCQQNTDCRQGLYCSSVSQTCTNQLAPTSACTSNEQCVNNASCDNLVCVALFSLPIGSSTTEVVSANGWAPSCTSGYATTASGVSTCAVAPVSAKSTITACTYPGGTCTAADGTSTQACACSYSGAGYCPLFVGDTTVTNMIASWQLLFPAEIGAACHTSNRWSYACFTKLGSVALGLYLNWYVYSSQFFDNTWVTGYGTSACTQQAVLADYYNVQQQIANPAPKCPQYSCVNSTLPSGQCVNYYQNIVSSQFFTQVELYTCNSSSTCQSSPVANSSCVANASRLLYPGEHCSSSSECLSGRCSKALCLGSAVYEACNTTADCAPGFYCGPGDTCIYAGRTGWPCSAAILCDTGYLCDAGACVGQYSLGIEKTTSVVNTVGYAPACRSGFAELGLGGLYYCSAAPVSGGSGGVMCTPGSMCYDLSKTYAKPCTCGLNGYGYCPSFEGDKYLQNAISNFMNISEVSCNGALGVSPGCFGKDLNSLLRFYYYRTNLTSYESLPYIQNSSTCLRQGFMGQYFSDLATINVLIKELKNSHSWGLGITAAILAVVY